MNNFLDYTEYILLATVALTHKYIALAIIVVADINDLKCIELRTQIAVLMLTGLGVVLKIVFSILDRRNRK